MEATVAAAVVVVVEEGKEEEGADQEGGESALEVEVEVVREERSSLRRVSRKWWMIQAGVVSWSTMRLRTGANWRRRLVDLTW